MGGTQENYSAFLEEQKAMSNNPTNHIGYTKVWEGKPTEFIKIIKKWSFLKEDYLKIESVENCSDIMLWVANEWIDWPNLRLMGTYREANKNNLRGFDSYQTKVGLDNQASDHRQS